MTKAQALVPVLWSFDHERNWRFMLPVYYDLGIIFLLLRQRPFAL
tara:strand:- start:175 stop:309 length:135 start_codon:yes stop_codon:yes gene_type:complete